MIKSFTDWRKTIYSIQAFSHCITDPCPVRAPQGRILSAALHWFCFSIRRELWEATLPNWVLWQLLGAIVMNALRRNVKTTQTDKSYTWWVLASLVIKLSEVQYGMTNNCLLLSLSVWLLLMLQEFFHKDPFRHKPTSSNCCCCAINSNHRLELWQRAVMNTCLVCTETIQLA